MLVVIKGFPSTYEDNGIHLAPKVGIYVMATNGFLVQQNFCGISVTCIGGENNDNICETNIGLYL